MRHDKRRSGKGNRYQYAEQPVCSSQIDLMHYLPYSNIQHFKGCAMVRLAAVPESGSDLLPTRTPGTSGTSSLISATLRFIHPRDSRQRTVKLS